MKTTHFTLWLMAATVTPFQLAELQSDDSSDLWGCDAKGPTHPDDLMVIFDGPTRIRYMLQDHHLLFPKYQSYENVYSVNN